MPHILPEFSVVCYNPDVLGPKPAIMASSTTNTRPPSSFVTSRSWWRPPSKKSAIVLAVDGSGQQKWLAAVTLNAWRSGQTPPPVPAPPDPGVDSQGLEVQIIKLHTYADGRRHRMPHYASPTPLRT